MKFTEVDRRSGLTPEAFKKEYLDPQIPVVFTDLIQDWPARDKWSFQYFKDHLGDIDIPVYDNEYLTPGKNYMKSRRTMPFRDYLSEIEEGPSDLRMFLFNIFKEAPGLMKDIRIPTIMNGFFQEFPFMFFGGRGSQVRTHYDIDCSHVFLTQFQTRKTVYLFAPEQSKYLYHLPFTVTIMADVLNPDYERFPALKHLKGRKCTLHHGETLFMPSMYWHHIVYTDGGFSLALRASDKMFTKVRGAFNIARHFVVDRGMNLLLGERWDKMKREIAIKRSVVE